MATPLYNIARVLVLLIVMMAAPFSGYAQTEQTNTSTIEASTTTTAAADTLDPAEALEKPERHKAFADEIDDEDAALTAAFDSLEAAFDNDAHFVDMPPASIQAPGSVLTDKDKADLAAVAAGPQIFIPDPQRALWLSFVIPGGGQIYNRKYWKLPIFYGGFLGCMYAFTWNQQMYMDYSQAYLDIMDDNPNTNSYIDMFPPSYDIESNISRFQTVFKNRKDRYRRWRDLSTFCLIGVYALSIIDAYVDAHLSVFDISPDLSLQWGPTSVEGPHRNFGLGATLRF